jgi:hypothetical protein
LLPKQSQSELQLPPLLLRHVKVLKQLFVVHSATSPQHALLSTHEFPSAMHVVELVVDDEDDDDDDELDDDELDDDELDDDEEDEVDVVPLTQAVAVPSVDASGHAEPHACPALQHLRLVPLPQGVVPAGHPHRPRLALMHATPL